MKLLNFIAYGAGIGLTIIFLAALYTFINGTQITIYEDSLTVAIVEFVFFTIALIGLVRLFVKEVRCRK